MKTRPCTIKATVNHSRRGESRIQQASAVTAAVLTALYSARALADPPLLASTDVSASTISATDSSSSTAASDSNASVLQEVTVTATRRAAAAQDLPMSITAISGNQLEQAGIQDVAQLAQSVAGIDFTDKGPFSGISGANLIIRGLNSDSTGWLLGEATPDVPPVATYVDDTPLFVNLRLDDLDRVEILRGPQGTLY